MAKEPNEWVESARSIIKSPLKTLASVAIVVAVISSGFAIRSCIAHENAKDNRIERAEVACAREGMNRQSQYTLDGQLWAVCYRRAGEYEYARTAVKVTP